MTETRNCLNCGKVLHGRADKKFCDDYCRNNYNNELKASNNNQIRNINNILRKNCRILEQCLTETKKGVKLPKDKLVRQGFNFKYHTHTFTNKNGAMYCFCYTVGYLALENDWFLVVSDLEEKA